MKNKIFRTKLSTTILLGFALTACSNTAEYAISPEPSNSSVPSNHSNSSNKQSQGEKQKSEEDKVIETVNPNQDGSMIEKTEEARKRKGDLDLTKLDVVNVKGDLLKSIKALF